MRFFEAKGNTMAEKQDETNNADYSYELRIPKERIAVIIGKKGEIKDQIEEATHSVLAIDSKEGDVQITGKDTLGMFTAKDVITAVGRGFNPDIAMLLLRTEYVLEIINMKDYVGKSKKQAIRLKGRVIGTEGKTRTNIERLTETYISVYGKTISIIGHPENVVLAREAIEKLLTGSEHSTVYHWLEKKQRELRHSEFTKEDLNLREVKGKETAES